jgi:hypothetical protein
VETLRRSRSPQPQLIGTRAAVGNRIHLLPIQVSNVLLAARVRRRGEKECPTSARRPLPCDDGVQIQRPRNAPSSGASPRLHTRPNGSGSETTVRAESLIIWSRWTLSGPEAVPPD